MRNILIILSLVLIGVFVYYILTNTQEGTATNTRPLDALGTALDVTDIASVSEEGVFSTLEQSSRQVLVSDVVNLPLAGSAPTENVTHTIPIEDIRQGCFRQDCIPSIDDPSFITVEQAKGLISDDSIGIALAYKDENRFYPFPMLETHELVNDIVAGDALLISYCPLCGTGIVFDRTIDGRAVAFGVSGMLWQSNLLMYNRDASLTNRNLWSQVLGEAVVGERAGQRLNIVPSDIMRFGLWADSNPEGAVLAGDPRDPYDGRYYEVARQFRPDFDETTSSIAPDAYVYGIHVEEQYRAYPLASLPEGTTVDTIGTVAVTIIKDSNGVRFLHENGDVLPDVEGFWFSWKAAHPQTTIWSN